jgi:hypothetical protein
LDFTSWASAVNVQAGVACQRTFQDRSSVRESRCDSRALFSISIPPVVLLSVPLRSRPLALQSASVMLMV